MFTFWKRNKDIDVKKVAKQQLDANREVFESLKAYDEGKKEISTANVKKHLRDLQPTL